MHNTNEIVDTNESRQLSNNISTAVYWWDNMGSCRLTVNTRASKIVKEHFIWWLEFLAADPEVLVRFPALPDFLRSSGSGTGSTQPREYN
jgi:hypothetical protein